MGKREEREMGHRHKVLLVLTLGAFLFTMVETAAAQTEIPRITIHELKAMIDQGESVLILDTRPKVLFDKGRIKDAISFPWKQRITFQDVSGLPRDKMLVAYCNCGPGDADSAGVAEQLMDFGFRNVKVLADPSIRGWMQAGYPMD